MWWEGGRGGVWERRGGEGGGVGGEVGGEEEEGKKTRDFKYGIAVRRRTPSPAKQE